MAVGDFDIGDVALLAPAGCATLSLPYTFQWTRRAAGLGDSYLVEIYDPADYQPRWLSPLLGYAEAYGLTRLLANCQLTPRRFGV